MRNRFAALAHLLSAAVLFYLYNHWSASKSRSSISAYRYQIAGPDSGTCTSTGEEPVDPGQCNVEIAYQPPKETFKVNIVYGALAFFLFTAAAHIYYATDAFGTGGYSKAIAAGWNPYRWFEYATSASLMSVLIGLIDGTRDTASLIGVFGITGAMMFNGYIVESLLRGRAPVGQMSRDAIRGATYSGWILYLSLWTVLLYSFGILVKDVQNLYAGVNGTDGKPIKVPDWIWFIVIFQALYYAAFGVVQYHHINKRLSGEPFNYESVENSYISLSYFAKLSLAGGIGYGLVFRTKDCPE